MNIRIRLFAIQRELAGSREVHVELADGSDVEGAWNALIARHPVLAPGRASLRFARNGVYAEPSTALADGDEVAMIPPVSGGSDGPGGEQYEQDEQDEHRAGGEDRRHVVGAATTSGSWAGALPALRCERSLVAHPATNDADTALIRASRLAPGSLVAAATTRDARPGDLRRHVR